MRIKAKDLLLYAFAIFWFGSYFYLKGKLIGFLPFLILLPLLHRGTRRDWNMLITAQIILAVWVGIGYFRTDRNLVGILDFADILFGIAVVAVLNWWLSGRTKEQRDIERIMSMTLTVLFFITIYIILRTPISAYGSAAFGEAAELNRNFVGMNLAWGAVFCFYFYKKTKYRKKRYLAAIIAAVFFILMTGSRKALLIFVAGTLGFKFVDDGQRKIFQNFVLVMVGVLAAYYLVLNIPFLYNMIGYRIEALVMQYLLNETTTEGSIVEREFFRTQAIELFKESPIFGSGMNAFYVRMVKIKYWNPTYSHCNITELLANFGIVGAVIYYAPRISLVITYFRKKLYKKSSLGALFFVVLLLLLVLEYGYVCYYTIYVQTLYVMAFLVSRIIPNEVKCYNRNRV